MSILEGKLNLRGTDVLFSEEIDAFLEEEKFIAVGESGKREYERILHASKLHFKIDITVSKDMLMCKVRKPRTGTLVTERGWIYREKDIHDLNKQYDRMILFIKETSENPLKR